MVSLPAYGCHAGECESGGRCYFRLKKILRENEFYRKSQHYVAPSSNLTMRGKIQPSNTGHCLATHARNQENPASAHHMFAY